MHEHTSFIMPKNYAQLQSFANIIERLSGHAMLITCNIQICGEIQFILVGTYFKGFDRKWVFAC